MDWFSIACVIVVAIGCILYCYGLTKEPEDDKEFSYRRIFTELFTDPTKKTRKIGTILIYAGVILMGIQTLLEKIF